MPDDAEKPNDLVPRESSIGIDQTSSRLIRRGMAALAGESRVCLRADDLLAYESSVFVLTENWDSSRWGRYEDPAWRRIWSEPRERVSEIWNGRRHVTLFEFHITGAFIRQLVLPLIKLTAYGFREIQDRDCIGISVRSDFIYFRESLGLGSYPDAKHHTVSYLFSRTGRRLAVWSDGDLVDQYRLDHEPRVPQSMWLQPDWVDEKRMISLSPRHDSLDAPVPLSWAERAGGVHSSDSLFVITQSTEDWIKHLNAIQKPLAPRRNTPSVLLNVHAYSAVSFPAWRSLGDYVGTSTMASDPVALWLLGDEADEQEMCERVVSKLEIVDNEPRISGYTLPHPYELLRQGAITLLDDTGGPWMPSADDYQRLKAGYDRQVRKAIFDRQVLKEGYDTRLLDLGDPEYLDMLDDEAFHGYDGRYQLKYSWRNDLVVSCAFRNDQLGHDGEVQLLFSLDGGVVRFVKQLDIDGGIRHAVKEANPGASVPWKGKTFADAHFFTLEEGYDGRSIVCVTNVNSDTVSWFRPEVPEAEQKTTEIPE